MRDLLGIAVATFGAKEWSDRAEVAIESITKQGLPYSYVHGRTLAEARNQAVEELDTYYVSVLDADDKLDENFGEAFRSYVRFDKDYLYKVSTLGWYPDGSYDDAPVMIPDKDMYVTNSLIVGTVVDKAGFLEAGGFAELPVLEDWDLFLRLIQQGYDIKECPDMIYVVGVNPDSRNQDSMIARTVYNEIRRTYRSNRRAYQCFQ